MLYDFLRMVMVLLLTANIICVILYAYLFVQAILDEKRGREWDDV